MPSIQRYKVLFATCAVIRLLPGISSAQTSVTVAIRPIDLKEAAGISFKDQIRPLLEAECGSCHAGAKPAGAFSVANFKSLMQGGAKGAGVVPGKPDDSPVVLYIRGLSKPQMPLGQKPLSVDGLHLIRQWIAAGAKEDAGPITGDRSPKTDIGPVEDESGLSLAVIRERHLKRLPPPPALPSPRGPSFNEIDRFIVACWPRVSTVAHRADPVQAATYPHKSNARHRKVINPQTSPSPPVPSLCDDATFVRRIYLDTVGYIPSSEEARAFVEDKTPDKRKALIDSLLARTDDYAANWILFWEDALCSNGKHQGGTGTRPNLRKWLTENLKKNRPYDEMVAELIQGTSPETKGWVRNGDHVETIQSAANVAQVFEGTALKCASCHNHFLNREWPQKKFIAFASYFAPKDLEVIRCEVHEGEFVPPAFIFDTPAARQPAPKNLEGRLKLVSRLLVDPENPRFAQSIVNRLWKRFLGLGLVEPADDFREDRQPANPALLVWLADDFMRSGYDLKHTIRLILNSRTYQLRFDPRLADSFDVGKPDLPRYYRSPSLRRLACEQLLDSVNIAMGADSPRLYMNDESTALTRALGKPAARNEVSTCRADDVAVVQALEILNGEEFSERVSTGKLPARLTEQPDPVMAIVHAYWCVYSRAPTGSEVEAGLKFLIGKQTIRAHARPAAVKVTDSKHATADVSVDSRTSGPSVEVWMDGSAPDGAKLQGTWNWVENPAAAGAKVHGSKDGQQQHLFIDSRKRLRIQPGDLLFVDVYLDSGSLPREIMLQWNDGTWDHRAYWGENRIEFGMDGTASRRGMGPLPTAGKWVRLEIPANRIGLAGRDVNGISFDQFDGHVLWAKAGVIHSAPPSKPIMDMLWALMASPEFQYIR